MTSDDKSDNDDDNKDDDDGEDVDDDAILPMTLWKTALIWSLFQTRDSNWFLATPTNSQIPSLGFYNEEEDDDDDLVDNDDHDNDIGKYGFINASGPNSSKNRYDNPSALVCKYLSDWGESTILHGGLTNFVGAQIVWKQGNQ